MKLYSLLSLQVKVIAIDSTINVRNVDDAVYRKFRGKCAELNKPTGEAVTEALEIWLKKYEGWVFIKKLSIDENHESVVLNSRGYYGAAAFTISPKASSQRLMIPTGKAYKMKLIVSKDGKEIPNSAEIILCKEEKFQLGTVTSLHKEDYNDLKQGIELTPIDLRHGDALVAYIKDEKGNEIHPVDVKLKTEADLYVERQALN